MYALLSAYIPNAFKKYLRRAPSPQMRTVGGVQLRNKIAVEIPSECLPNINDLRQIFDDQPAGSRHSHNAASSLPNGCSAEAAIQKRSSHTERTLMQQTSTFFDAKPSHLEENIFESKSRNLEFERAKQKFDNPSHLQHQHHHHQREQRERSSGRFIGSSQQNQHQTSGNRSNLALPLKTTNTSGLGMSVSGSGSASFNSNANTNSNPNSCKDDVSRHLFMEDHSHSSKTGGADGGNVGEAVVVGIGGTARAASTNQSVGGSYSRNSINLDGLKVSDDEVSTSKVASSSISSIYTYVFRLVLNYNFYVEISIYINFNHTFDLKMQFAYNISFVFVCIYVLCLW